MTSELVPFIQDSEKDFADLKMAVKLLQSPSLTAKISNFVGSPLESLISKLPESVSKQLNGAVEGALHKAADAALWSLDNKKKNAPASNIQHKLMSAVSGAVGGAFGFASLLVELPVSTTLMMRSVADVARSEGFDLTELSTKEACIEVFAMGGDTKHDDATEIGYYVTRGFTTEAIKLLAKELAALAAKNGTAAVTIGLSPTQAAKLLAALIEKVAARFGIVISSKFAAQAVPIIGAVTGASLNTLFTDYYQDMAKGHFIIKRLEAKYGFDEIKKEYEKIAGIKKPS
jgi:hypothetical protein